MFYAEYNRYGIDTTTQDTKGRMVSAGIVYRFDTRLLRDEWVADDDWDSNFHRSVITRRDAALYHPGAFSDRAVWCPEMYSDGPEMFTGEIKPW